MNISDIYTKLYNNIGNYYTDIIGESNDYIIEKYFDIESQKYFNIIKSRNKLSTYSFESVDNNNSSDICMINDLMPKYLILGSGFDRINSLEWKRTSMKNDYMVLYKVSHYILFEEIKKIHDKIECKENIDFEKILKLYIDCGKKLDLTLTYLEL